MNSFFLSYEREDFFLFCFQQIVEQEQNPTLLTYNCLDAGLYTIADTMSTCRIWSCGTGSLWTSRNRTYMYLLSLSEERRV